MRVAWAALWVAAGVVSLWAGAAQGETVTADGPMERAALRSSGWSIQQMNVALNTPKGAELVLDALSRNASQSARIVLLSALQGLETQMNLGACGPASAVTVLNALKFKLPEDIVYRPYHVWTQENFIYHPCTRQVIGAAVFGESLANLTSILHCMGLKTRMVYGNSESPAAIAGMVRSELYLGHFVIANFNRSLVLEGHGGHFSPIGAVTMSNMALILDVARYKYPPTFTPLEYLVSAMASRDSSTSKSRGFVSVWA